NANVIERLALIDTIVFDKTGTLTDPANAKVSYVGEVLSAETKSVLKSMVASSTHPLSNRINHWLGNQAGESLDQIHEIKGAGIQAVYKNQELKLGSCDF